MTKSSLPSNRMPFDVCVPQHSGQCRICFGEKCTRSCGEQPLVECDVKGLD